MARLITECNSDAVRVAVGCNIRKKIGEAVVRYRTYGYECCFRVRSDLAVIENENGGPMAAVSVTAAIVVLRPLKVSCDPSVNIR